MPITTSGTQITFNDGTVQSTAARSGSTNITFTSTNSNVTLTNTSNAQQRFLTGSPVPINPTVTLPNMTTVGAGPGLFTFRSATSYNVGVNDAGGNLRQLFPTNTVDDIGVWDASTANGQWATTGTPLLSGYASTGTDVTLTGIQQGTGAIFPGSAVRLSSTEFAYVWTEQVSAGSSLAIYAKYYSVNPTTNAITGGNVVTVINTINMSTSTTANWNVQSGATLVYDCDFAGRALVLMGIAGQNGPGGYAYGVTFGLVASGGVLYATTAVSQASAVGFNSCCGAGVLAMYPQFCSYLGSNNAFAVAFTLTNGAQYPVPTTTVYWYAYTLTGTTSPVLTAGTGNGSANAPNSAYCASSGSRLGQTTFAIRGTTANGEVYAYTPASNSVTRTSLSGNTVYNVLANNNYAAVVGSSFALGGYMYNSSSQYANSGSVYTVSSSGATTAVAVASSVNTKPPLMGDYTPTTGSAPFATSRKIAVFNPGGAQISVGSAWQTTDLTSATWNSSVSTAQSSFVNPDILLSNSCGLGVTPTGSARAYTSVLVRFVRIASPYVV